MTTRYSLDGKAATIANEIMKLQNKCFDKGLELLRNTKGDEPNAEVDAILAEAKTIQSTYASALVDLIDVPGLQCAGDINDWLIDNSEYEKTGEVIITYAPMPIIIEAKGKAYEQFMAILDLRQSYDNAIKLINENLDEAVDDLGQLDEHTYNRFESNIHEISVEFYETLRVLMETFVSVLKNENVPDVHEFRKFAAININHGTKTVTFRKLTEAELEAAKIENWFYADSPSNMHH